MKEFYELNSPERVLKFQTTECLFLFIIVLFSEWLVMEDLEKDITFLTNRNVRCWEIVVNLYFHEQSNYTHLG